MDNLDSEILNLFALNVRKFRKGQKLSQAQLAFEIDISLRQLQRIENGEFKTNVITAYKLAEALNISINELFDK